MSVSAARNPDDARQIIVSTNDGLEINQLTLDVDAARTFWHHLGQLLAQVDTDLAEAEQEEGELEDAAAEEDEDEPYDFPS